jgi:hypothetical protein
MRFNQLHTIPTHEICVPSVLVRLSKLLVCSSTSRLPNANLLPVLVKPSPELDDNVKNVVGLGGNRGNSERPDSIRRQSRMVGRRPTIVWTQSRPTYELECTPKLYCLHSSSSKIHSESYCKLSVTIQQ